MFEFQSDPARNLVQLRFRGAVTPAEMKEVADQTESMVASMLPGFTVFTDLTGLESMDLDCVSHLTRFMDTCKSHGVATVVRVIPDASKDIGFNILSIIHYRRGVKIITCETLAEAGRVLE